MTTPVRILTLTIGIALVISTDTFGQHSVNDKSLARNGVKEFFANYCVDCHSADDPAGELDLESTLDNPISEHSVVLERAVRQLRARRMPPIDETRPGESEFETAVAALESALDQSAERNPDPGRTETFRRLNRSEYRTPFRRLLLPGSPFWDYRK